MFGPGNAQLPLPPMLMFDRISHISIDGGEHGKGKIVAKAKRNLPKGLTAMPVGVAPKLTGHRRATAQLMVGGGDCFRGTVERVRDASGSLFKGTTP